MQKWSLLHNDSDHITLSLLETIPGMSTLLIGYLADGLESSPFPIPARQRIVSASALAVSTMLDEGSFPVLLSAVKTQGFLLRPFQRSTASQDYDTTHALGLLALKIAGFEVGKIAEGCMEGGRELVELLLLMNEVSELSEPFEV